MTKIVTISIVSHRQIELVEKLFADIARHCNTEAIEIILTLNLPEELPFSESDFPYSLRILRNPYPRGFGENHNRAFKIAGSDFFCVMNPDISFEKDPFQPLLECLKDASIGVAAPLVLNEVGNIEDSARCFPTPLKILCKALGGGRGNDYDVKNEVIFPDWVGGMFMLFPRGIFAQLDGFDQRFFLYYEDVDLCARLRLQGYRVALSPHAKVTHYAHRSSHRKLKYLRWHLASMMRFFCSAVFGRTCWFKFKGGRE
jgi:hypothetical protein